MDCSEAQSSFRCEIRIIRAKNIEFKSMGCLFVRCYIPTGKNKKIRLDSQEISSDSNFIWNQSFSLDCFGTQVSMSMLMQDYVIFELRWRNTIPMLGRLIFGKSRLLGRAEIPWKSMSGMDFEKWVVMKPRKYRGFREDVKPPAVQVGLKVGVPAEALPEIPRPGRSGNKLRKCYEHCECMDGGCRSCLDHYRFFALDAALEYSL